jgi:hypothetical protein
MQLAKIEYGCPLPEPGAVELLRIGVSLKVLGS